MLSRIEAAGLGGSFVDECIVVWPAADVRIPRKRAKGRKNLSAEDRAYNYSINAPRSISENEFRRIKVYSLVGGIFRGTIVGLGNMVVFITGAVNLQRLMGSIDPEKPHRKGPIGERPEIGWAGRKPHKTPDSVSRPSRRMQNSFAGRMPPDGMPKTPLISTPTRNFHFDSTSFRDRNSKFDRSFFNFAKHHGMFRAKLVN